MDFTFTEEMQAVSDLARQIMGDASAPEDLRVLERSGEPRFDQRLWLKLAEAGLLGMGAPESAGGAGLSLLEVGVVIHAAGRTAAAVPVWECLGLAAPSLVASDAPAAATALAALVAGTHIVTGAWHEAAGDPLAPQTTATPGDEATITGTKVCVPAGQVAHSAVVTARAEGEVGLYLVDLDGPGIERHALDTTAGTPDSEIVFDAAPATRIATGDEALNAAYNAAVATQCAFILGCCESALELTSTYTTERKQFGVPLASFQAVGHRAADAYIDTEAIRLTTWQALWRMADGRDASDQIAIAQYWAAFGGQRVVHSAVHLHGGVGVDRDYPLARFFTAAKQSELQLGGSTQALVRLGRQIAASN